MPSVKMTTRGTVRFSTRVRLGARSDTAATAASNALLLLTGLATGILSARALDPAGRGEFLAVYTWFGVLGVVLNGAASQALATYVRRGLDRRQTRRFILRHLGFSFAVAAVLASGVLFTGAVSWLNSAHSLGGVLLAVATVAVADMSGVALGRGSLRTGLPQVRLLPMACGLCMMILLACAGNRSPGVWLTLTGGAHLLSGLLIFARLTHDDAMPTGEMETPTLTAMLRTAGRFYAMGIASQVNYRLDLLAVSVLLPRAAVANYGIASAAGMAVAALGQAVGTVHFSRFASPEARADAGPAVRRAAAKAAMFSAAVAVPTACLSPILVRLLYGPEYREAVAPTIILVLAAIPLSVDFLLIHAFLGLQELFGRLYVILGFTTAATIAGILLVTRATDELAWIAVVSPTVYCCSVMLLLRLSLRLKDV